jgi:uncharacterized damage-inducible protein DinB
MSSDILIHQLNFNHQVLKANTEGLTQEDSLIQPQPGGNCLNWVLGHVVATRNGMLRLVGREPIWDKAKSDLYKRGSAPTTDAAKAVPLADMLSDLDASQEALVAALGATSADQLAAKAPFSPTNSENETLGTAFGLFIFHEAYHAGQVGLLRRLAGMEGVIR